MKKDKTSSRLAGLLAKRRTAPRCATCNLPNVGEIDLDIIEWLDLRRAGESISLHFFWKEHLVPERNYPLKIGAFRNHVVNCLGENPS